MTLAWIQLAAAVGACQGLLLAGALVAQRSNRLANRLLAALMVAFTVYLLSALYYSSGLTRSHPHLFGISYPLPWIFGPLVYLYTVAASDRARRFGWRDALHLAPPVAIVAATLPIYVMSGAEKLALLARLEAGDTPPLLAVIDPLKYVSGIAYTAATVAHLRRHARRIRKSYANTERVDLRWLLLLSGAAAAIWLLTLSLELLDLVPPRLEGREDDLVVLAIALLVYAIGYMGLRQPEIFRYEDSPAALPAEPRPAETAPAESFGAPAERAEARYERSGLGSAEAARLRSGLLALMEREQPYRDPELTLADLAGRLDTTPHKLSEVLNAELGQTFYDFVNGYRVDDVRRRLGDPRARQLKLLALAMDAGFASKSTFNDAFKRRTGETPSSYRRALAG